VIHDVCQLASIVCKSPIPSTILYLSTPTFLDLLCNLMKLPHPSTSFDYIWQLNIGRYKAVDRSENETRSSQESHWSSGTEFQSNVKKLPFLKMWVRFLSNSTCLTKLNTNIMPVIGILTSLFWFTTVHDMDFWDIAQP